MQKPSYKSEVENSRNGASKLAHWGKGTCHVSLGTKVWSPEPTGNRLYNAVLTSTRTVAMLPCAGAYKQHM